MPTAKSSARAPLAPIPAARLSNPDRPESLNKLDRQFSLREGRPLFSRRGAAAPEGRPKSAAGKAGAAGRDAAGEVWLLRLDPAVDMDRALQEYRANPAVLSAEPNYIGSLAYVPSDPLYNQERTDLNMIGLEQAWNVQRGANASVRVAVIDSGIDPMHPDLAGALDLADSYNFVDKNTSVFDDIGHGTRVAGILGATANNGEGIAGVAFGCKMMSLDVADPTGVITVADVAAAIAWALGHGANVINISLCFHTYSVTLDGACRDAAAMGALVVAAAGNESQGDFPVYPAAFEGVLGIGAVAPDGSRCPWSNFNGACRTLVDLAAPGETIFSTIPNSQYNGSYNSGTSFATPIVSGVAALLKAKYPQQSGGAIVQHLLETADPVGPNFEPRGGAGAGTLNAARALGTPMQPNFSIDSVTIDDSPAYSATNNGDGRLQKGERVRLLVSLKNSHADAFNVSGSLTTTDTLVTLADRQAQWQDLGNGQVKTTEDGFTSLTLSATAPAHAIPFRLNVAATGMTTQTLGFVVQAESNSTPPTLITTDTTWGPDSTWVINAHTFVMPTARLTIKPGAIVRFDTSGMLEVRGTLDAQGTASQPITLTSLKGKPDGKFKPPYSYPSGIINPDNVAFGDADNDGLLETIYVDGDHNLIHFCRWDGVAMNLSEAKTINFPPYGVIISDVNNDGLNEVVTADTYHNKLYSVPCGNLGLGDPVVLANCPYPYWLAAGDVDNDGKNEILAACYKNVAIKTGFRLFMLKFNGTAYTSVELASADRQFWDLKIGDFNNDGLNEIGCMYVGELDAYRNPLPGEVHIWRVNGSQITELGLVLQLNLVYQALGDVDNDGKQEIAITHHGGCRIVRMVGTTITDVAGISDDLPTWSANLVTDYNGDGKNELLIGGRHGQNNINIYHWNGSQFIQDQTLNTAVLPFRLMAGDLNGDGSRDLLSSGPEQTSMFLWDANAINGSQYPGLWLTSLAGTSTLTHCNFRFGPVLDEAAGTQFTDCLFDRTGGDYALSSLSGTNPLVRCTALGNTQGHGIVAGGKSLTGCVASNNRGIGLQGGTMTDCQASGNGSIGIAGYHDGPFDWTNLLPAGNEVNAQALNCQAMGNGKTGIDVKSLALNCTSSGNGARGIDAHDVTSCTAAGNLGDGISGITIRNCVAMQNGGKGIRTWAADPANATSTVDNSQALKNGDMGIEVARQISNSLAVDNGKGGLKCEDTITGSLAMNNQGSGLDALNEVSSCVAYRNARHGALHCFRKVSNSWLVANGQYGYYSDASAFNPAASRGALEQCLIERNSGPGVMKYAAIKNCTIRDNGGPGVLSAFSMSGSNLYGNGGASGLDYVEDRLSKTLMQIDLSGNYWGPQTTPLMNAHPWNTYFNIPAIYDFLDNTSLCDIVYDPHLAAAGGSALPDGSAPAFLLSVTPTPATPVNVGVTQFQLTFSKPMNRTQPLAVSFGRQMPYTTNIIKPAPGWINNTTWQGTFAIQRNTSDGTYTLCVSGAVDAGGFALPEDTAHQFVVETSGAMSANNGLAIGQGTKMLLSWNPPAADDPTPIQGYNVKRSTDGLNYVKVNTTMLSPQHLVYTDTGLQVETDYYYIIEAVIEGGPTEIWAWLWGNSGDELMPPSPPNTAVRDWAIYQ